MPCRPLRGRPDHPCVVRSPAHAGLGSVSTLLGGHVAITSKAAYKNLSQDSYQAGMRRARDPP
jgi:hypothetical protein